MQEFFETSAFAGVTVSLLSYMLGIWLKKKFKSGIFNPLLVSVIATILVLVVCHVDYESYNAGAKYLSWFLTPATVCLAIPLYEQLELLKANWKAVVAGIVSGVFTSLVVVFLMALLFKLEHGRVRGAGRPCDHYGSGDRSHRRFGKYSGRGSM